MSQVINTNIASINAQRNLSQSQGDLGVSLERLSSGLRINSAADDAAGLAISERFTAQITGLNQASRNSSDGISFAQTAEGALGEVGNSLQRIRELAVQSANDTNSAGDREALDNEVQELVSEVNRIAESSEFNGQNVLDGSLEELVFQVGANANQTITSQGVDVSGDNLGAQVFEGTALDGENLDDLAELGEESLSINGVDIDLSDVESVADVVGAINERGADTEVTARQDSRTQAVLDDFSGGTGAELSINGVSINVDGQSADSVVDAVNEASSRTNGVRAELGSDDELVLTSTSSQIDVEANGVFTGGDDLETTFEAGIVLEGRIDRGDINVEADTGDLDTLGLTDVEDGQETRTLNDNVDVLTRENATNTIELMDSALNQVNTARSQLGAVQTRFESTIANLEVSSENLSAARSRIQDADFAEETAALTRGQILQQAGTSVLSQANQIPQNTLSLLQ